jgi:CTP:phosphocholine cytidylyltransferase-like protein
MKQEPQWFFRQEKSHPGKGNIEIATQVDQETRHVVEDVKYVSGFKRNMLSYVSLERKGSRLVYDSDKRYTSNESGFRIAQVKVPNFSIQNSNH